MHKTIKPNNYINNSTTKISHVMSLINYDA